jgi:uncharacterized coiled-coil DUF342 family protein
MPAPTQALQELQGMTQQCAQAQLQALQPAQALRELQAQLPGLRQALQELEARLQEQELEQELELEALQELQELQAQLQAWNTRCERHSAVQTTAKSGDVRRSTRPESLQATSPTLQATSRGRAFCACRTRPHLTV